MSRSVTFGSVAWEDYLWWQTQDKRTLKKINRLIQAIRRDPENGEGQPERLSANLSGHWSRRIDQQNRLVYRCLQDSILILQVRGHYDD